MFIPLNAASLSSMECIVTVATEVGTFVLSISISEKAPTLSPPLSVGCGSGFDSYFGEARLGSHPLSISFHRHGTA